MSVQPGHPRVHSGQIVAAQVALVTVVAAGGHPGAVLAAGALLAATFVRLRRRWLYEWLRSAAGMATRRRTAPVDAGPEALLALVRPGVRPVHDDPTAVLADRYGIGAVLELEEPLVGGSRPVTVPTGGLPGLSAGVRLLVRGLAAPVGSDPAAASYQELTGGGAVTVRRMLLVVRVPDGGDLAAAVRAARRRVGPLVAEIAEPDTVRQVLAEFGCRAPVREGWSGVRAGGLRHVTYRITPRTGKPGDLVPHLLVLPAAANVVTVDHGTVTLRTVLDPTADPGAVEAALTRMLAAGPEAWRRLDGDHLPGLAATLPLPDPYADPSGPKPVVPVGPAGLILGHDRHGAPVRLPLFRRRPVRAVLIGPLAWAHLLAWRGLGAGARVVVHTRRPAAWQPVVRAAVGRPPVLPAPGSATVTAAEPGRPVLRVLDGDTSPRLPGDPWHAQLVLCEQVRSADVDLLTRADLVLALPLDDRAATLVSAALGLGRHGGRLRETAAGTLTMISHGEVHRVRVGMTATERALTAGHPSLTISTG